MGLITIDYRDRKLIYEQLVDNVKLLVLRGDLKKNDFLPSVRSLAKDLGINPNTIQKAYAELERQGIIASIAGRGSVVIQDLREDFLVLGVAEALSVAMIRRICKRLEIWHIHVIPACRELFHSTSAAFRETGIA